MINKYQAIFIIFGVILGSVVDGVTAIILGALIGWIVGGLIK